MLPSLQAGQKRRPRRRREDELVHVGREGIDLPLALLDGDHVAVRVEEEGRQTWVLSREGKDEVGDVWDLLKHLELRAKVPCVRLEVLSHALKVGVGMDGLDPKKAAKALDCKPFLLLQHLRHL